MTLTVKDLDEIEERLKDNFVTKNDFTEYKSDLFDKLDQIVKNTSDTNTETELLENRVSKIEDRLNIQL
jgi:GTPase involved in cell partitioning and DNA repair